MTHPLDRIIQEQADYYNMTVEEYSQFTHRLAEIAEAISEADEMGNMY